MSSSNAERPSLSKRSSARTHSVSGSETESSCSRSSNGSVVLPTTVAVDSEDVSGSGISSEQLKRKKRRKNVHESNGGEGNLLRRVLESGRCKKPELKMIEKAKLKVAIVQLVRLEDERRLQERLERRQQEQKQRKQEQQPVAVATEPKFEEVKRDVEEPEKRSKKVEEEKVEERLRLPGLTLPAKVDPRILQQQLVVKINKHQTEKLLQSKRRLVQTAVDTSECADKLTEKLTDGVSLGDDNKCTKNANVSNSSSGKRVVRIPVDKSNNDRLPDRLLKDNSKCLADSATPAEVSVSDSQPESSKRFVNSCRRQKRSSIDQRSSDKQSADLLEGRPKCPKETSEKCLESVAKDTKRYSKNKDEEKQFDAPAAGHVKKNDNEKQQSELPCDKSKKVLKSVVIVVENQPRPRRNLASKNGEKHSNEPFENNQSDKPLAQNEKLSAKVEKSIQNSSKSQSDSHKKITRKAAEKHVHHVESAFDSKADNDKRLIEEHSKNHAKRKDRKIECSKNETDSTKNFAKRADNKHETSSDSLTEICINNVVNSVDAPEKLPDKLVKDVKVCIENQIENVVKSQKSADVKSDKSNENVLANKLNGAQNVTEKICNNQSQNVHNNIQFSKNSNEINKVVLKDSPGIADIIDESSRSHSKNSDKKIAKSSRIGINIKKQSKINIINNSNEKQVKNLIDNNFQNTPNIVQEQNKDNLHIRKERKNVPEINQRPKRRLATKTCEANIEVTAENRLDCKEDSVDKTNKRLTKHLNTNIIECKTNIEIDKKATKRISEKKDEHSDTLTENNSDRNQPQHESDKKEIPEQLILEENTKSQTENVKRVKRKNSFEIAHNSIEENQKVLPDDSCKTLKNCSKSQVEKTIVNKLTNRKQKKHIKNTNQLPARKRGRPKKYILKDAKALVKNNSESTEQKLIQKQNDHPRLSDDSKVIRRKSQLNKHEKVEKTVKHCLTNSHKTIEKNEDQLPEVPQEIVKICSKSQIENQKRVTRKSSSDKHERQTENVSKKSYECIQNSIDKTDDKVSDKTQRKIKECLKIQSESFKRVTRKSVPENHEKQAENLIVNSLDITQTITNDQDEILSEKLNNKENSKNQIEISQKITRCSPLKRDRQSKNLVENNVDCVDCVQMLVDENRDKGPENIINNFKVFPNAKKLRRNSIDKNNEMNTEFSVENDNTAHNIVEENIDNENKLPENICENNDETKRNCISKEVQNTAENDLDPQFPLDSTDKNQLVSIDENNLDSINVECNSDDRQSGADENIKNCSNGLIDGKLAQIVAEEILSRTEYLIENKEMVAEVAADVRKEPKIDSEILAQESVKEYMKDQSLTEEYQNEIESIVQYQKESTNIDNTCEPLNHADPASCAKIILEELFEISANAPGQCTDNNFEPSQNLSLEFDDSTTQSAEEPIEVPCENLDTQNEGKRLTRIGDANPICTEDFDEVIKYFCIPANQKDTIIENTAEKISENEYLNLNDKIVNASELKPNDESYKNDSATNESISSSFENTREVVEPKETENVYTESIEAGLMKGVVNALESLEEIVNISLDENHAAISPSLNREITLLELRKKCTENLERRLSATQENFADSLTYPVLPAEDSGNLESDKSSTSSTDSSDENDGSESEEGNYPDSVDSDENLADRLAQLRSLEIPPLNSSDDADSGVQTTSEVHQQQKRIGKIVLRCPRRSFMEAKTLAATAKLEFDCKDCGESFMSNRELKKHIKVQHRQRLVIKIRKTDENKHAAHIVEQPVPKRISKEQEDDDEDEGNASASPEKLDEDELVRVHEDERITEGDIKIIVRKEGGSKNTHVIKEIKITPKSNSDGGSSTRIPSSSPARSDFGSGYSSSRIPGSSPARSDLGSSIGGGNSCRMPGNSPPRFDIVPVTNPVKRGRGRPRKYPIFTEAELIAKHLGAPTNTQTNNGATNARKKKDESPFIVEGIFGKRNEDDLFEVVESIVIQPDFLFDSPPNDQISVKKEEHKEDRVIAEIPVVEEVAPLVQQPIIIKKTDIVVPSTKRKRGRTLSQESLISAKAEAAAIVQDEKKLKIMDYGAETDRMKSGEEPKISQMPERSISEPDLRAKYHITKELVVQLTKIDTVPKDDEDDSVDDQVGDNAKLIDANTEGEVTAAVPVDDTPQRRTKPKIIVNELLRVGEGSLPDLRAVIRLNLRRKLESNNNNLVANNIDKCLTSTTNSSPQQAATPAEIASADKSDGIEESTSMRVQATPQLDKILLNQELPLLQPETQPQHQSQLQLNEISRRTSTSKNSCGDCNCEFHIDDDFDSFEDNQTLISESEQHLIAAPQTPTIGRSEVDNSHKINLNMLMNGTPTPCASGNNVVATIDPTSISSQPLQLQSQAQVPSQLQSPVPIQVQLQSPLSPYVHHQAPLQSQQMRPKVQTSPLTPTQLSSQLPLSALTPIQSPPQIQAPQPSHSQLLQLQQATEGLQAQLQLPPQAQLVQLNQSQQFCILFFPESDGTTPTKDRPPTATIVNFQPVPDNEIANKPLIFMPTTPTKISIDDHAKQYVCATCSQVLDIIGRLEASLGMTEEDKSVIKCPYCSNHFQSLFYLEYHMMQEHLKCENEKQCRHASFSNLRIPNHEAASEFEIYITFALKCRSCYDIFNTVLQLNDHVMHKHKTLVRLKPASLPFPSISTVGPAFPPGSPFIRKNGGPAHVAVLQCPSDCVCRIGIRSTDSPLQRQQMLKRCPNAMRRLEKIEPAAYEVYTCTLCKSTFLMKDEVVDHLMKMHEVSCKYPCYTCLTSFRSLQMQENHRCSETTLQDLDKLLSIAILPVNVSGSGKDDRTKYMEREDSSTDEYGAIKAAAATSNTTSPTAAMQQGSNGYKRKNGETVAALQNFLTANAAKKAKLVVTERMTTIQKASYKRRRVCPKCKQKFAARKALQEHVINDHILKGDARQGPRKIAIDLMRILTASLADDQSANDINDILKGFSEEDVKVVKNLMALDTDERENWENGIDKDLTNGFHTSQCSICNKKISMPAELGNHVGQDDYPESGKALTKPLICEACENGGPLTRRRTDEGHRPPALQFFCKKCPEVYPSLMELKYHKRITHNVICDGCKKSFTSVRMLEKHKRHHRDCSLDNSSKPTTEDDNTNSSQVTSECNKDNREANDSLNNKSNSSNRRDSSDSSGTSKEPEEQPLNCSFCEEVCSSKVSLKNHLKREHGRRASICQFCNGLLIDTSEVRHMLDYHIVPSKSTSRSILAKSNGTILHCEASCMQDDVEELVRTLGKHRLQSLMMYHDFEGKCNNAIMRCPLCPELFATRESCRFHYVWIHDDTCLLCDETFRSGSSAFQHKVDAHTSTASYLWCIQRLVTAIVYTLRLDPDQPSHVLYQILAMRIENDEAAAFQDEQVAVRGATGTTEKTSTEEAATDTERFGLEAVVLSEDQLPDSSNIIEVVIGKEDSEDDLLSMLNLSPSYESSSEQHRLRNAGTAPPEEEEDEETTAAAAVAAMAVSSVPTTPILSSTVASTTPTPIGSTSLTSSPAVENYVTSGVCKYRLENDEEQLVLVVTDDDLITFRDDIGSLAERISMTCDSLTLDEITEMLRAYFDSMNGVTTSGAGA